MSPFLTRKVRCWTDCTGRYWLEELTVPQLANNFPSFYSKRSFVSYPQPYIQGPFFILPSKVWSNKLSGFPIKPPSINFTIRATWPTNLDYWNNVCRRITSMKLSIMPFTLFFATISVLFPTTFPSTPNLEHPQPVCLRKCDRPIYTPT
jgi:hypothetical protein